MDSDGSVFQDSHPQLVTFLRRMAADPTPSPLRMVAHNFLLDERISPLRAASYAESGLAGFTETSDWIEAHTDYLHERVYLSQEPAIPGQLELGSLAADRHALRLPETFVDATLTQTDDTTELVRVVDADVLERMSGCAAGQLSDAAADFLATRDRGEAPDRRQTSLILGALQAWNRLHDQRPVTVALAEDLADVLGASPDARPAWPDRLRDRLGLAHLDPGLRGHLPIWVFRYPVAAVAPIPVRGSQRPLVVPTVLDGPLCATFCPVPRESRWGYAVDLEDGIMPERSPARILVHPALNLCLEDLDRVGLVSAPVTANLPAARQAHLRTLRHLCGRRDWATSTDSNIADAPATLHAPATSQESSR